MFSTDLAIDLGTANTVVFARDHDIVVNEPTIVAVRTDDHTIVAAGREAKAMLGRTPEHLATIRPVRDGVIADFDLTVQMLQRFIARAPGRRRAFVRPHVVVGVPSGTTEVERRAVRDSARQAIGREVFLVEHAAAAALGAGLPVHEPGGNLIADIGGGTTEVAVISLSGTVHCESVRIAGDEMDEAIVQWVKRHYNLLIGERQAEAIKIALASATPGAGAPRTMPVKGRDLVDGIPKTIVLGDGEVREAIREPLATIVETVRACLERIPPELAADIVDTGLLLTGGGALVRGLDELLREETALPVAVVPDPLGCVARGAGQMLDDLALLRRVAVTVGT